MPVVVETSSGLSGFSDGSSLLPPVHSSINTKSFQPSVDLYLSTVPAGTYNVALKYVALLNEDEDIEEGFSINEKIVVIFELLKAP